MVNMLNCTFAQEVAVDWIISRLCPRATEGDEILNCILVVVDRLSKDRIYEPLTSKSVNDLADAMHRRVFYVKG
jgi:hypothetical protein